MSTIWIMLLLIQAYSCEDVEEIFKEINEITTKFNAIGADIAWQSSVDPANLSLPNKVAAYQKKKINWQHKECRILGKLHDRMVLNLTEERQAYLLCRGPSYTYNEARKISILYEDLQSIYSKASVCIPTTEASSMENITTIEQAITKYISDVQSYLTSNADAVHVAAKLAATNLEKDGLCLKREEDFERIMKHSRKQEVLEWVWLVWRELMKPMRIVYRKLVEVENNAARRSGYTDIGASWRDELEIPNLRETCHRLYNEIKPLYTLLHGFIRFSLRRHYGNVVPERGPIPAYFLGNLWSQNWGPLIDVIFPDINLDDRMQKLNWTVKDMVKKAEDFYISLGLPPMTEAFWRESIFSRENRSLARCHGTAADMFKHGDFRLLHCSKVSFEDFYIIHHEMGHLEYYMAYENQPGLFRQANAALHETIGDTIMQAVLTPHHLHRLRLINDSELYNTRASGIAETKRELNNEIIIEDSEKLDKFDENIDFEHVNDKIDFEHVNDNIDFEHVNDNIDFEHVNDRSYYWKQFEDFDKITTDDILLLKQALNKLPQIPFAVLIDEYRWRYFEGSLNLDNMNEEFWAMAEEFQGIAPGSLRGEEYFDIGAIFHVPDNTPYIRYFLSSFLQHQLYERLCKASVFGHRNIKDSLPSSIYLDRCDIYGSKSAGRILKDLMSRGHSQHWRQIIQESLGQDEIVSSALQRYYRPLYVLLIKLTKKYNIPIGW